MLYIELLQAGNLNKNNLQLQQWQFYLKFSLYIT